MIRDSPTRWNSAFKMLSRAVYLRKAIEQFIESDPKLYRFRLSKSEWEQAEFLLNIFIAIQCLQLTTGADHSPWNLQGVLGLRVSFQ